MTAMDPAQRLIFAVASVLFAGATLVACESAASDGRGDADQGCVALAGFGDLRLFDAAALETPEAILGAAIPFPRAFPPYVDEVTANVRRSTKSDREPAFVVRANPSSASMPITHIVYARVPTCAAPHVPTPAPTTISDRQVYVIDPDPLVDERVATASTVMFRQGSVWVHLTLIWFGEPPPDDVVADEFAAWLSLIPR